MVEQPAPRAISRSAAHLQVVREGMIRTVHGPGGTARVISGGLPYLIAGKTGTAQVVSRRGNISVNPRNLPMHLRHRALFIGYAPAENPTIALAVVVEGGGYGASTAAPIARKILDAWLLGKMPEPDPGALAAELAANPFANVVTGANTAPAGPTVVDTGVEHLTTAPDTAVPVTTEPVTTKPVTTKPVTTEPAP